MLPNPIAMGLSPLASRVGLSERVAEALAERNASGALAPGVRLEAEGEMARQLGVSRTVVREAVSRLKSDGLLESRQSSGVYMREQALRIDPRALASIDDVLHIVALRRAIEAEAAALAVEQRSKTQLQAIEEALKAIDAAVLRGEDGVEEDVRFHRRIAEATGNPYFLAVLAFLYQYLRGARRVTRANEARRADFARQVREEHRAILAAIRDRNPAAARRAAARHMQNAARRMRSADAASSESKAATSPVERKKA